MARDTATDALPPLTRFRAPRYWPVWLGLGLLRMASFLPVRAQLALGRGLGRLACRTVPGRRRVAATNLALCFPERSAAERDELLRQHFASLGMTLMEHGLAWWSSEALVRARSTCWRPWRRAGESCC
jgi:KDO2-lipid IV(A) lauroyltransferase